MGNSQSLAAIQQISNTVLCRTCPLTFGRPTVFYGKASFKAACANEQRKASLYYVDGRRRVRAKPEGLCGRCLGTKIPREIEIRPIEEGMRMAASKIGICGLCDDKTVVRSIHGMSACSTCQSILAHVNNRIDTVIAAIKYLKPERLADLVGESVAVDVESDALKRIAAAVGFKGDDGDGLVAAVEGLCRAAAGDDDGRAMRDALICQVREAVGAGDDEPLIEYLEALVASKNEAWERIGAIWTAMDIDGADIDLVRAVKTMRGDYAAAIAANENLSDCWVLLKSTLGLDADTDERLIVERVAELCHGIAQYQERNGELTGKVADIAAALEMPAYSATIKGNRTPGSFGGPR